MELPKKHYRPTQADEDDAAERRRHEAEMKQAQERLEKQRIRKKRTLLCALIGIFVGLLNIAFITCGASIYLPDGRSLYEAYTALADDRSLSYLLLDFAPPVVLSTLGAVFVSRGERGRIYFILTALLALFIVLAIFMFYMALASMG